MALTVKQLIEMLQKEPQDNIVHIVYDMTDAGGGCFDEAEDVEDDDENKITSILSRKAQVR